MRILLVAGFFPPKAPMGAIRTGSLAEYWRRSGHDVRVIAVALPQQDWAHEQAAGVPAHYIAYSEPGQIVTNLVSAIRKALPDRNQSGSGSASDPSGTQRMWANPTAKLDRPGAADLYRQLLLLPDRYRSWIKPAVKAAKLWATEWQPDLIYSSGPPNSGHIVARKLARHFSIPWIAEIRDAWFGNPNDYTHWLVAPLFNRQARRTLGQADGLVVVTEADRKEMARHFSAPIALSYNGYDPAEFDGLGEVEPLDREHLTILHAGAIYAGRRDPTPLFRAIAQLGQHAKDVRCLFYGDQTGTVALMAEACGVGAQVEVRAMLRRSQVLLLERQVDVLLECHWQDPAGDGVIPGKLFEYVGAHRPILSLGSETAEAAIIVRDNALGLASNDPEQIRPMLLQWLAAKQTFGRVSDIGGSAEERFQGCHQFS
jgi:glycosyltransferase involved in cell wall biosynthesis